MLSVAEQFAGQTMKCPNCAGTFTVPVPPPGSFTPGVAPAAPPPVPSFGSGTTSPAPPPVTGYQHAVSLSLRSEYLKFLAPLSLLLVFFLTFAPWVTAGITVEDRGSYSGWQTSFGEHSNVLGLLYAILFILTLLAGLAAGAIAVVPASVLPPGLQRLMPLLPAGVALGALLCFALLTLQLVGGFGPEDQPQKQKFAEQIKLDWDAKYKDQANLNFSHTLWLRMVVFFQILAIVGCTLHVWLAMRGRQSPPRIDFTW
jgi:hypothetical protein